VSPQHEETDLLALRRRNFLDNSYLSTVYEANAAYVIVHETVLTDAPEVTEKCLIEKERDIHVAKGCSVITCHVCLI